MVRHVGHRRRLGDLEAIVSVAILSRGIVSIAMALLSVDHASAAWG